MSKPAFSKLKALILLLLALCLSAVLIGCASERAPIRLTPLDEAAETDDGAAGRVTIRAHGAAPVPAAVPTPEATPAPGDTPPQLYVLNRSSKRFHFPACSSVDEMKPSNREERTATREELLAEGYIPCGRCKP